MATNFFEKNKYIKHLLVLAAFAGFLGALLGFGLTWILFLTGLALLLLPIAIALQTFRGRRKMAAVLLIIFLTCLVLVLKFTDEIAGMYRLEHSSSMDSKGQN